MRVRSIQAETSYATCNGELVVPVAPVEKAWTIDPNKGKIVKIKEAAVDPWGGCNPGGARSRYAPEVGVRCKKYRPDRNGEIIDDKVFTDCVVRPVDIKGEWTEYMVLHGERVRVEADRRDWDAKLRDTRNDFLAAAQALFPGITRVSTTLREVYRFTTPDFERIDSAQITIHVENATEMRKLLELLLPDGAEISDNLAALPAMMENKKKR